MKKPGGKGRTKTSKQEYGENGNQKMGEVDPNPGGSFKEVGRLCVSNEWNEFVW